MSYAFIDFSVWVNYKVKLEVITFSIWEYVELLYIR